MTLPSEASKGKLPYIEDGDEVLADSGFIVLHLKDMDTGLNPAELALSVAMQRLLRSIFIGVPYFRDGSIQMQLANHKRSHVWHHAAKHP